MIVRAWRGRAPASNPFGYVDHFRRSVLPALRRTEGFVGASLLKAERPNEVEFLVLTKWKSMDAIRAFAGDDVTKAIVDSEAAEELTSFDPTVEHYDVVDEAGR
jgi:heme-degrading monooxygenase HmoA